MRILPPRLAALSAALSAALLATAAPAAAGSLVIVGGGLSAANADVHKAFLARRPAGSPAIAIIPSASGSPADSAAAFAAALVRHGARPEDIVVVHLAALDDPTTPSVDESRWAANATAPAEIAKLEGAGAIWFTGGDQLRTTRLLAPGGRETPMLKAIRARLAAGAVIGGSSAGAAIMSEPMITGGEPLAALTRPVLRQAEPDNRVAGGGLVMGRGLGFLPDGLVDQHFDARRRLGRLARALFELPQPERFGFGIDEDTALAVDLTAGTAEVVGTAGVTLLDARRASRTPGPRFGAQGLVLGFAVAGDRIALGSLAIRPGGGRAPITPAAADDEAPAVPDGMGGMAVPEPTTNRLLAAGLFQRSGATTLDRPSLGPDGGVVYRFTRAPGAAAWGSRDPTIAGVGFAIRPLGSKAPAP